MSAAGDNRLAVLAAEIRVAHAGVVAAATVAAERAIEAGTALTEAKELVPHGQWLPWLKEHCQLSVRTAQVYMKIVRLGLTAPVVAEMGLKGAADAICVLHDPGYNPFHHCDEGQQRQWHLFILFGHSPQHVEWLLQQQYTTPDEWLGSEGSAHRRPYGWGDPTAAYLDAWAAFQQEYRNKLTAEIVAEAAAKMAAADEPRPRRRRPKYAPAAHLPDPPRRGPLGDLAGRIRALSTQSDPHVLRAGLAAIAAELDAPPVSP